MAFALTHKTVYGANEDQSQYQTAALTFTAGAKVIVVVFNPGSPTPAISGFAQIGSVQNIDTSRRLTVFESNTTPANGPITATFEGGAESCNIWVGEIPDTYGSPLVRQPPVTVTWRGNTSPALTFPTAPLASSAALVAVVSNSLNDITFNTPYVGQAAGTTGTPPMRSEVGILSSGAPSSTVVTASGGTSIPHGAIMFEFRKAEDPPVARIIPTTQSDAAGGIFEWDGRTSSGNSLSYSWSITDAGGTGATNAMLTDRLTSQPKLLDVSALSPGTGIITLTVTDASGLAASTTADFTVVNVNATLAYQAWDDAAQAWVAMGDVGLWDGANFDGEAPTAPAPPVITYPTSPVAVAVPFGETTTLTVTATGADPKTYQWRKNGADISGATSTSYVASTTGAYTCRVTNSVTTVTSAAFDVTVAAAPAPAFSPLRYDLGSASATTLNGVTFAADTVTSGGTPNSVNLGQPAIYQTEVWGGPNFPSSQTPVVSLPISTAGRYLIRAHFCEVAHNAAGARVMDVVISGDIYDQNLDIYQAAGGKGVPLVREYVVDLTPGDTLTFNVYADAASISALEIMDGAGMTLSPTYEPPAQPTGTRDPRYWPFSVDSPWNKPLTSAAIYAGTSDPGTAQVLAGSTNINGNNGYSHSAWIASDSDPIRTWTETHSSGVESYVPSEVGASSIQQRIPDGAMPASGTDGHLHSLHGDSVVETWLATRSSATANISATRVVRVNLRGSGIMCYGTRAYDGSAIAGLIRLWELEQGAIRHAIALGMNNDGQLKEGPIWPAATDDGGTGLTYSGGGEIPMGCMFAIPKTVDLADVTFTEGGMTKGLNREGMILARALQNYGSFVVDTAGPTVFYLEEKIGSDAEVNAWQWKLQRADGTSNAGREQLKAIKNLLRRVTNSSNGDTSQVRANKAPGTAWNGTPYTDPAPLFIGDGTPAPAVPTIASITPGSGQASVAFSTVTGATSYTVETLADAVTAPTTGPVTPIQVSEGSFYVSGDLRSDTLTNVAAGSKILAVVTTIAATAGTGSIDQGLVLASVGGNQAAQVFNAGKVTAWIGNAPSSASARASFTVTYTAPSGGLGGIKLYELPANATLVSVLGAGTAGGTTIDLGSYSATAAGSWSVSALATAVGTTNHAITSSFTVNTSQHSRYAWATRTHGAATVAPDWNWTTTSAASALALTFAPAT